MDGTAENRQGSLASSRPVCHGDSVAPAAQEQQPPPIRSRTDHMTQAVGDILSPNCSRVQRPCQQLCIGTEVFTSVLRSY